MAVSRTVIRKVLAVETEEVRTGYHLSHLRLFTPLPGCRRTRPAFHRIDEPAQLDTLFDARSLPCLKGRREQQPLPLSTVTHLWS